MLTSTETRCRLIVGFVVATLLGPALAARADEPAKAPTAKSAKEQTPAQAPARPASPAEASASAPAAAPVAAAAAAATPGSLAGSVPVAAPVMVEGPREAFIGFPPAPSGSALPTRRAKPLRMTVGIPPTASDLGSELDVGPSSYDSAGVNIAELSNWNLNLKGYIRAPLRIGLGPRDDTPNLNPSGLELHSPPRMVGFSSSSWSYIAIAPNSSASLRATVSNARVSGTLILTANTFSDVGYDDIDSLGGVAQAYVTIKFADAFGDRGGIAATLGSFSNSYGDAGPRQTNTGFYGTYLFGRTHVVGADVTADYDLTDHTELLFEQGFGAKLDLIPTLGGNLPKQMFIPGDPREKLGSNFLYHAHAGIWVDDWLKIGAHYMTSWTPNERIAQTYVPVEEGRLSSTGVDLHFDHPRYGNFYLGYSHVWGHNLYPLDEALQVIHGGRGYDFKLEYFGNKLRQLGVTNYIPNDGGRVETVLFQYLVRSMDLLQYRQFRQSVNLTLFAMFSHAYSPPTGTALDMPAPGLRGPFTVDDNKLKYGSQVEYAAFRHLSVNGRVDRVQPTSGDPQQSYTALSGQLVIRSDWRSNRMVIVDYTRFLLGAHCYPDSPYSTSSLNKIADANLFVVSAIMSL